VLSLSFLTLGQAGGGSGANPMMTVLFLGAMLAVMWFIMIRPQQKQLREHRTMLASLVKGDEVVTQGGLFGKIHAITDRVVTLEIASGVRVRVLKTSIQGKAATAEAAASGEAAKKEEKAEEKKEEK
jgi:preprotein translocase subunit YajC